MNLALFYFDGTITSSDTWTPFMRFAVRPVRLLAWAPLIPAVVGYWLGLVSASRVRQMAARVGFQGEKAEAVRHLGIEYATTVLPRTLRQSALAISTRSVCSRLRVRRQRRGPTDARAGKKYYRWNEV